MHIVLFFLKHHQGHGFSSGAKNPIWVVLDSETRFGSMHILHIMHNTVRRAPFKGAKAAAPGVYLAAPCNLAGTTGSGQGPPG